MVFGQLCMYANVAGTSKKVAVFGISYIGQRIVPILASEVC